MRAHIYHTQPITYTQPTMYTDTHHRHTTCECAHTHIAMHTCTRACMCTLCDTQIPLPHPRCLSHRGLAFVPPGPLSIPPGTCTWLAALLWPHTTFGSTLRAMLRVRGVSQTSKRGPAPQAEGQGPCNMGNSMAQEAEFP